MRKIIIITILIMVLFLSPISTCYGKEEFNLNQKTTGIPDEIDIIKNKTLTVDEIIGEKHVKYWQHIINGFIVKNDSILLHLNIVTDEVLNYKISWTDLTVNPPEFQYDTFELNNYFWKKKVIFPDEDDFGFFYTIDDTVEFPLFCWEVRYTDGTTIIYDSSGVEIGHGIPAPSRGFSLRGWGDTLWRSWRDNAYSWFNKWCGIVYNYDRPTVNQISNHIKKSQVDFFYVIAHSDGKPTRFVANDDKVYYTSNQLREDMSRRSPMGFSLLCCCEAMRETGPGTLSYELRKGEMTNTVTIGYVNMGSGPFHYAYVWQDFMFEKIDQGNSFKKAFDLACAEYPSLYDYVRFMGDENFELDDIKEIPDDPDQGKYTHPLGIKDIIKSRVVFPILRIFSIIWRLTS